MRVPPDTAPGMWPHGLARPIQIAYAVRDVTSAAHRWADAMGAGPFFLAEHVPLRNVRYRGKPGAFDHSSAYGQWGSIMVELVQDHTQGPSPIEDLLGPARAGLHHLAFWVEDLDAEIARLRARGWEEALRADTAGPVSFAFCDAGAELGHMIELYEPVDALTAFYAMVAEAAEGWDGREPLRSFGRK